jgi:hypothetical protein
MHYNLVDKLGYSLKIFPGIFSSGWHKGKFLGKIDGNFTAFVQLFTEDFFSFVALVLIYMH